MRLFLIAAASLMVSCSGKKELKDQGGLSPEEALKTLRVAPGFRVELFAAEPLVADPVAMEVDEAGNVYVVEMHGYPLDKSGSGIIKLLKDKNRDGRPDEAVVFADGLTLPSGIMRWKNGVLVTDMPNLLYLEDTNGDGKAEVRDTVITGMALSNPQHNGNTPVYGPDNWIYIAHESSITPVVYTKEFGDKGSPVRYVKGGHQATLPLNANGRNIRLKPGQGLLEMCSGESQYGQTFDPRGHHFFTANANHLFHEAIAARYLQQNPYLQAAGATADIPDHGNACKVFPITESPHVELLTDVGVITSACGVTWYKGGAFPDSFRNVTFVAEPVHNLVHADRVVDHGASFKASRIYPEREFLASTDPWFRPVQFYVGPDGALYVMDYYREFIEHPEWMSEEVAASGRLYHGHTKGRIYRIVPDKGIDNNWMGKQLINPGSSSSLLEALGSRNEWYRRNAQRLIVDHADTGSASLIRDMVSDSHPAEQVISALWTLEGLHALDKSTVLRAMKHPDGGVRENAIRLAESLLPDNDIANGLRTLTGDADIKVRYQLLCTSGLMDDAAKLRNDLLLQHLQDPWFRIAALASSGGEEEELLAAMIKDRSAGALDMIQDISALLALKNEEGPLRRIAMMLNDSRTNEHVKTAVLAGLTRTVSAGASSLSTARPEILGAADGLILQQTGQLLRQQATELLVAMKGSDRSGLLEKARQGALDKNAAIAYRMNCIQLLSIFPGSISKEQATQWMGPAMPVDLQKEAALSYMRTDPAAASMLIPRWKELTLPIRMAVLEQCMEDEHNTEMLVDGLANKTIQPSSLPWHMQVSLMNHDNMKIRKRSRELLSNQYGNRDEILKQYQQVLSMKGDAVKGQNVFSNNCNTCHQKGEGNGNAFGPDLSSIANRDPSFILADIIKPERSIADGYEWWDIQLTDGRKAGGIIGTETATHIGLRDPSGKQEMIARNKISAMQASDRSAMPQGLEKQMTMEQMADLLAYLRTNQ